MQVSAKRAAITPLSLALVGLLVGCANHPGSAQPRAADHSAGPMPSGQVIPSRPGDAGVSGSGYGGPASSVSAAASGNGTTAVPPPPFRQSSTPAGIVYLTASDSGRIIDVSIGTRIEIALAPSLGSYHPPTSDAASVLREHDQHGGYPAATTAIAEFRALGQGTARITSETDLACLHVKPACAPPQREFLVTIVVR
jgi:hypothetical protein